MLFTKQIIVFGSLLVGTLAQAAAIPMPVANAVSELKLRDVKMISAYQKRQDDVVTMDDNQPAKAPDGITVPYPRKRQDDVVTMDDNQPAKAPDGVTSIFNRVSMLFTKQIVIFASLLVGTLAHAAAIPMPGTNAVSELKLRDVKMISAYQKRQDDVVTMNDNQPAKAPDGVTVPYPRKRQDDVVTMNDSQPAKAPDGVTVPYPRKRQDDVVTMNDNQPAKAPDGVTVPYPRKRQDDVVTMNDNEPAKAPDGVTVPYPRKLARQVLPRMKRVRSSRRHA
ncbi:unnamed protein product [Rhizoctonia solani]|uniref:Uncharacterized protein n=2 Tax=Rhizoctonia solani TaxID=456999 RepID=A0A8H3DJL9_9AGAM|nr:unnamed protein product [Rhizoctonia solani]